MLINDAYSLYKTNPSPENYEQLGETLLSYVTHLVNREYKRRCNSSELEDIKSDALIEVLKSLPNFRGEAQFATWVRAIVSRRGRDLIQNESRKAALPLLDIDLPFNPSDHSFLIGELIKDLEPYDRVLIQMTLRGFEENEIAEKLGIPIGTASAQISRLKTHLRTLAGGISEG